MPAGVRAAKAPARQRLRHWWRHSLSTSEHVAIAIAVAITGFFSCWFLSLVFEPDCRGMPSEPPDDDSGDRNLCPSKFSGTCTTTVNAVRTLSGECVNGRMAGHWKALLGSQSNGWEGDYCNGKPCNSVLIHLDADHTSRRNYDNEGQPTGLWEEYTHISRVWCKAEGHMTAEGRDGEWTKSMNGRVTSKIRYVGGQEKERRGFDCNGLHVGTDPCPDPCPDPPAR